MLAATVYATLADQKLSYIYQSYNKLSKFHKVLFERRTHLVLHFYKTDAQEAMICLISVA